MDREQALSWLALEGWESCTAGYLRGFKNTTRFIYWIRGSTKIRNISVTALAYTNHGSTKYYTDKQIRRCVEFVERMGAV